jgi:hypothetical protein
MVTRIILARNLYLVELLKSAERFDEAQALLQLKSQAASAQMQLEPGPEQ